MTGAWRRPSWLQGDERLLRIGPGTRGDEDYACPAQGAAKARPHLRARVVSRLPGPQLETFTLGPVSAALDQVEFGGQGVESALAGLQRADPPLHPGHRTYVEAVVSRYVETYARGDLVPVQPYWVVQRRGNKAQRWELYAWWRRYRSRDGRLREVRRLRHGSVGESAEGEVAVAAYVAAHGIEASWPSPWREPFRPREHEPFARESTEPQTEHVRVVEIGLDDGERRVCFEGTVAMAKALYDQHGHEFVATTVAGSEAEPGSSCPRCKLFTGCDAVPRTPGILGLASQRASLRKASVSDLRYHRMCPAQAFLRSLHLPKSDEYSTEAKLGQAVHAYLEKLHRRAGHPPCTVDDLPAVGESWTTGRWRVPAEAEEVGRRMLESHLDWCPFQDTALISRVEPERLLTFHDTAAQAVVFAKPDLLMLEDGSWVWREVKTTQKHRFRRDDPLEEFPQLALAVLLLERGALGGDPAGSRIEVEVLRPEYGDTLLIDPTDPERIDKARDVLRGYAAPWRVDEAFEARPGRHCQWCPVSLWCPSSAAG